MAACLVFLVLEFEAELVWVVALLVGVAVFVASDFVVSFEVGFDGVAVFADESAFCYFFFDGVEGFLSDAA